MQPEPWRAISKMVTNAKMSEITSSTLGMPQGQNIQPKRKTQRVFGIGVD